MLQHVVKSYWYENELKQNTYIIELDDKCILVDAGCPPNEIKRYTAKPISAVLITHAHFDHVTYIEEYDRLNIPIYVHKNALQILSNEDLNVSNMFDQPKQFHIKHLRYVDDGDIIDLGVEVKAYYTPGHSSDSMSYLIGNDLYSGDTLFSVAIGRYDLATSNKKDLISSLKKLQKLKFNNLYAGHGRVSNFDEQQSNIDYWIKILQN